MDKISFLVVLLKWNGSNQSMERCHTSGLWWNDKLNLFSYWYRCSQLLRIQCG